jgi:hypothetical protein
VGRADIDGVGERRSQPHKEAVRADVERRADKDNVDGQGPSKEGRPDRTIGASEETTTRVGGDI